MEEPIADRTAAINADQVEPQKQSQNALKKAAKQKKLAEEKANKSATNTTKEAGRAGATKATAPTPKKKQEGAALISINVAKEDDFSAWYTQVLTKGDMLDYYDISGCYILKVGKAKFINVPLLTGDSLPRSSSGKRFKRGSIKRSRVLESKIALFLSSCRKMYLKKKRIISKASRRR